MQKYALISAWKMILNILNDCDVSNMSINRKLAVKISKIILLAITLMFSFGRFHRPRAKIYNEVYWSKDIFLEYADREWSREGAIACFRTRAFVLDELVKKIYFLYDENSLRNSWELPQKLHEEFGLEYEINNCVKVSHSDYEILKNLKNIRDAYRMISLSLDGAVRNRRYSI